MYDKKDFGYFKKCLASNGEIMIFNKKTNQSITYLKNNSGKLEMKCLEGKKVGRDAIISFLSLINNPSFKIKVSKEAETSINNKFLDYLNNEEKLYQNKINIDKGVISI